MSRALLWLGGALALLALAGLLYWQNPPLPLPAEPSARRAPQSPARGTAPAAAEPAAAPTTPSLVAAVLHSALSARFRDLDAVRGSLGPLYSADVAAAAQALGESREPGAAAALAELDALCGELDDSSGEALRAADARARLAATRDSAVAATLKALADAERGARERLRAGCAAAAFDRASIERRLGESARAGDAASLERLVAAGALPTTRLESAALLGSPRAALRLGLDRLPSEPLVARSWLEAAARGDADAEAFYATCLLAGCAGAADPAAGRAALESAARRGALYALGLLAAPAVADAANQWSPAGVPVAPVPPRDADAHAPDGADRYAWSALAAELAAAGCFGFEQSIAAQALGARARLERSLPPSALPVARARARELADALGGTIRDARGCD